MRGPNSTAVPSKSRLQRGPNRNWRCTPTTARGYGPAPLPARPVADASLGRAGCRLNGTGRNVNQGAMRVLITGSEGYIGTILAPYLMARGHDVTGVDTGFHRVGWLYNGVDRAPAWRAADVRQLTVDDLRGFDAVVHLAELSNDPRRPAQPGRHLRDQPPRQRRAGDDGPRGRRRAVRLHVVVQRLRRRRRTPSARRRRRSSR